MHYLINSLHSSESALHVYRKIRKICYKKGKYIVIAAMPKSGSTFLSRTISGITKYEHSYFAFAYKNIEQELYLPKMVDSYGVGSVVQQHFKANDANINLLNDFNIKPIVLVRNIFDLVISVKDHLTKESIDNLPSVYPSKKFLNYSENQQIDYIIDFIIPWYVTYYISWYQAEELEKINFMWLVYDEMIKDWSGSVKRALEFNEIEFSDSEVNNALDKMGSKTTKDTRINKGISGRGKNTLTKEQIARIVKLTDYYNEVDFTRIGI